MSGRAFLVSYATANRTCRFRQYQEALNRSALEVGGFSEVVSWNEDRLHLTDFYRANRAILDLPRGGGCWIWKPYIILEQLRSVDDGDFVVYHDSGSIRHQEYRFARCMRPVLQWCEERLGGLCPGAYTWHRQGHWTKRDCFVYMGCDSPAYWESPQIAARWSIWQKNARTVPILERWLLSMQDARVVSDEPNACGLPDLEGFRAHRHDQSVLTNVLVAEAPELGLGALGREHAVDSLPQYWE